MKVVKLIPFVLSLVTVISATSFDINGQEPLLEDDPKLSALAGENTLLWGPYRSSLYFGVRPRIPRSLLSGLMWFNADTYQLLSNFRHFYEQHDNMAKANWVEYDPRIGGKQVIEDSDCHITITIDFIKSEDGKSWAVKVHSKPHVGYELATTSFIWYSGLETEKGIDTVGGIPNMEDVDFSNQEDGYLFLETTKSTNGYKGNLKLSGVSESLGLFSIEINDGPITNKHPKNSIGRSDLNPRKTHHLSLKVPNDNVWKAKEIFTTIMQDSINDLLQGNHENLRNFPPQQLFIMRDLQGFEGNLHLVQKLYQGESEFDIVYNSGLSNEAFTFENINEKIKNGLAKVNAKYDSHFQPLSAPFNKNPKYVKFGREILSGLLGGLTYSYGEHYVDRKTQIDEESYENLKLKGELEGPYELFSLVPSRPFFPRGFYWDEGFHLLPLLNYDPGLVLEILQSWFDLIDENGWIAREQILGDELRSRVPEEFVTQSPEIVNPPTLMLAFCYILDIAEKSRDENPNIDEPQIVQEYGKFGDNKEHLPYLLNYSREIYPKLKSHYFMFRKTQIGYNEDFGRESYNELYRWRGRTLTHCLASGLDDYPRTLPADVAELNVDLLSWIGVMTKSMKLLAKLLDYQEDLQLYQGYEEEIVKNLEEIHWSKEDKTYCDVSVDEDDENMYACFKGYISLFPFLTKLTPVDDVDKLEHIVTLLSDPEELWSPYGIRSLSKSDKLYRSGENYWRSPIWLHINYLVLESLQYYQTASKEFLSKDLKAKVSETYEQLRLNLVNNAYNEWERTGFVWEQYDDETGASKGAKNFLGWSSTILLMMKMPSTI